MSKKLKINNKPASADKRKEQKEKKVQKGKFEDLSFEALMGYIEALEKRIKKLETKTK